jgi:hypothetical protein
MHTLESRSKALGYLKIRDIALGISVLHNMNPRVAHGDIKVRSSLESVKIDLTINIRRGYAVEPRLRV